jgi:hypothetical protein
MLQLLTAKNQGPTRHQAVDVVAVANTKGGFGHWGLWGDVTHLLTETTSTEMMLRLPVERPKEED